MKTKAKQTIKIQYDIDYYQLLIKDEFEFIGAKPYESNLSTYKNVDDAIEFIIKFNKNRNINLNRKTIFENFFKYIDRTEQGVRWLEVVNDELDGWIEEGFVYDSLVQVYQDGYEAELFDYWLAFDDEDFIVETLFNQLEFKLVGVRGYSQGDYATILAHKELDHNFLTSSFMTGEGYYLLAVLDENNETIDSIATGYVANEKVLRELIHDYFGLEEDEYTIVEDKEYIY